MNINRIEELHNQLPPSSSIDLFNIKVTAKNIDAKIPIIISFIFMLQSDDVTIQLLNPYSLLIHSAAASPDNIAPSTAPRLKISPAKATGIGVVE